MSERIFEPLVERIKRQGGNVVGSQLVSRCARSLTAASAREPDARNNSLFQGFTAPQEVLRWC